jgi:hypothetical protein
MAECCTVCAAKDRRTPSDPTLGWESYMPLCGSCAAQSEWRTTTEQPLPPPDPMMVQALLMR